MPTQPIFTPESRAFRARTVVPVQSERRLHLLVSTRFIGREPVPTSPENALFHQMGLASNYGDDKDANPAFRGDLP